MIEKWLYGPEKFPGLSRNGPLVSKLPEKVIPNDIFASTSPIPICFVARDW